MRMLLRRSREMIVCEFRDRYLQELCSSAFFLGVTERTEVYLQKIVFARYAWYWIPKEGCPRLLMEGLTGLDCFGFGKDALHKRDVSLMCIDVRVKLVVTTIEAVANSAVRVYYTIDQKLHCDIALERRNVVVWLRLSTSYRAELREIMPCNADSRITSKRSPRGIWWPRKAPLVSEILR
eukprot:2319918-Amphidinium_carterae.1